VIVNDYTFQLLRQYNLVRKPGAHPRPLYEFHNKIRIYNIGIKYRICTRDYAEISLRGV